MSDARRELDLNLLAAAYESGHDLFLTGNFGGFGGVFFSVHLNETEARKRIEEIKAIPGMYGQVYRVRVTAEEEKP
jgi:hypothetical protein